MPSPNVAEDHQTKNAMALVGKDAALLIADTEAPAKLYDAALALLANPTQQQQLATNVRQLAHPGALA